jgi:AraC family transcriptional regulator, arabinose operon regulatory protein
MRLLNYLNLNQHPIKLSFRKDRSHEFDEIYHSHQGIEFLYVHSGQGKVITGGKIMELKKGALFYFKPFHMHRIQINKENVPYIRTLFVFEPTAILNYLQPFCGLTTFFRELFMDPLSETVFTEIPENRFDNFIEENEGWLARTPSPELLETEAFFLVSFINLLRQYISNDNLNLKIQSAYKTTETIGLTLDWLEKYYMKEFKLNELATAVHLSPNHLSYLFHKETGSSISEYIAVRRIQEACMLLKTSSLSIEEVGRKIGINNFSYFCKFFKKYVGVTPYNFKKNQYINI